MAESGADEKALVEGARRDPRRFAELYALHFDRVYAYIARRVPARPDVQDLTSEVFQQALAHLPRFEWRGVPFAAWLYRIAANAVADHYQRAVVYRAVRELPADQRRVIELRFAAEQSIAEIRRSCAARTWRGPGRGTISRAWRRCCAVCRAKDSVNDRARRWREPRARRKEPR
jgi:DNA-directed RNA polymerase specialized sigma24 family protein